jgi:hypothetical protein
MLRLSGETCSASCWCFNFACVDALNCLDSINRRYAVCGAPVNPSSFSHLAPQFHGRLKEVLVQTQLPVQPAQQIQLRRGVQSPVPHLLGHVRPVALLHPGIVVLLVWPRARHPDLSPPAVAPEQVVHQRLSLYGWISRNRNGARFLIRSSPSWVACWLRVGIASASHQLAMSTAHQRMHILPRGAAPTVLHEVHLQVANFTGVPFRSYLQRHLLVQQRVHPWASIPASPHLPFPFQQPVDGGRRNFLQPLGHLVAAPQFPVPAQPVGVFPQRCHRPLPAGLVEQLPHHRQRAHHLKPVARFSPCSPAFSHGPRMRQLPDQYLPVQPRPPPGLVQWLALFLLARSPLLFP